MGGSELEHGEEIGGVLFVSRGEPPEVFDPIEEAVARSVETGLKQGLPATMNHCGYIRGRTCGFDAATQPTS